MKNIKLPHPINRNGFTIIELIVVFSIMAVLSTVGVASFVTYSRVQTLQQATNDLITTLNTAKAKAVSQTAPEDCVAVSRGLNAYQVQILANSYRLQAICSGISYPISTTSLPNGVSFDPSTTISTVSFEILTGGVNGSGTIVLTATGVSNKTITVTSGGLIQ